MQGVRWRAAGGPVQLQSFHGPSPKSKWIHSCQTKQAVLSVSVQPEVTCSKVETSHFLFVIMNLQVQNLNSELKSTL